MKIRITRLKSSSLARERPRSLTIDFVSKQPLQLLGGNGVGKTSILRSIANLGPGKVEFSDWPNGKRPSISSALDFYGFNSSWVVDDIISHHAWVLKWKASEWSVMLKMLDQLAISKLRRRKIRELSLGTRQMLRVSLCLSTTADLVLLDEPFRALDQDRIQIVAEKISQISCNDTALLLTSHHDTVELLPSTSRIDLEEYWAPYLHT